jgi:K+-dependent Na+/Ca+ exchanger-like protein
LARRYWLGFCGLVAVSLCLAELIHSSQRSADRGGERRLADDGQLIEDAFTLEQRRQGAVVLHCFGLLYIFVAIALVCDECFVPALEVITDVLELTPDVAGATFMAAGGSAPEFFTSLVGAFSESDIGTGTIIGSAVFNVLFVIGACAVAAQKPLELTWFPLARDSIIYAISLIVITCFFMDGEVRYYEALILFLIYVGYVIFMRYNEQIQEWATSFNRSEPAEQDNDGEVKVLPMDTPVEETVGKDDSDARARAWDGDMEPNAETPEAESGDGQRLSTTGGQPRDSSKGSVRSSSNKSPGNRSPDTRKQFRHHSRRFSKGGSKLQSEVVTARGDQGQTSMVDGDIVTEDDEPPDSQHPPPEDPHIVVEQVRDGVSPPKDLVGVVPCPPSYASSRKLSKGSRSEEPKGSSGKNPDKPDAVAEVEDEDASDTDEPDEPLTLAPPQDGGVLDWIGYVVKLPIILCLVLTIPDVRREGWRKFYPITFIMSILWIAVFVYAMIWLVESVAETVGLADKEHIMGLTILAAGTSVPDFLSSVIVAREGHGDMAISSSIGSNIFDVTIGLPIPWLLYAAANSGKAITIQNKGLEVNVLLLLAMLAVTIFSIMCHGWVMNKMMGVSMLLLYVIFVVISVILASLPEESVSLFAAA